jgi:hypothetical protein
MEQFRPETAPADACSLYMEHRRRAMSALYRYAIENEAAHYQLMMCMHGRGWVPLPSRVPPDYRSIPYPEDVVYPPRQSGTI